MSRLRFALVLFLTVALDLSAPVPQPHGPQETLEEFEDAVHRLGGRRPFRHVRETVAPALARRAGAAELESSRPRITAPAPPPAPVRPVRKLPPRLAEPAAAPDAH